MHLIENTASPSRGPEDVEELADALVHRVRLLLAQVHVVLLVEHDQDRVQNLRGDPGNKRGGTLPRPVISTRLITLNTVSWTRP